jgi:acetylornithine deacetylase
MTEPTIDEEYVVRTAVDLVRIDSVNPAFGGCGEGKVAAFVERLLDDLGMEVLRIETEPGRPSVMGRLRGGDGASLMLTGHYDTVGVEGMPDPFSGAIKDGRIHGRGSFDMKGAIAACVGAVKALRDSGARLPGDVIVAAVADEEVASLGTLDVLRHVRPDRVIVTEPTGLRICVAHKGFVWAEFESAGRAAHGSRPDLGVDANLALLPVLGALDAHGRELRTRAPHPLVGAPSLHVATLRGGTGLSTYAASAVAGVERRLVPGEDPAAVVAELESLLPLDRRHDIAFRHVLSRGAFQASSSLPVVMRLRDACQRECGMPPELVGEGPWTDATFFADAGAETVVIGPEGGGAHAAHEWVDIQSLRALSRILARVAADT